MRLDIGAKKPDVFYLKVKEVKREKRNRKRVVHGRWGNREMRLGGNISPFQGSQGCLLASLHLVFLVMRVLHQKV